MRTPRQTKILRALLWALKSIPQGYLLPDSVLRADASRVCLPRPTQAELDEGISTADCDRLITGVQGQEETKWKISEQGLAWLSENP